MKILSALPFSDQESLVGSPIGPVKLFSFQIAVTVSLVLGKTVSRTFPAVIDTGLNQSFAITETHLQQWLGCALHNCRCGVLRRLPVKPSRSARLVCAFMEMCEAR